jgi:hypothetical protein
MMISEPLTWLCEAPRHSPIANRVFRKGWPDLVNFFLLRRPLELGRALSEERRDRKQGHINDLLRQEARAIKAFDEKLVQLGWKPEGAPASRKKASALATGMKNA